MNDQAAWLPACREGCQPRVFGCGWQCGRLGSLEPQPFDLYAYFEGCHGDEVGSLSTAEAANTAVEWQQASLKVLILYVYLEGCQACHCHSVRDQPRLAAFRSRPPLIEFLRPYVAVSPAWP
jgi:hypothetical protein